MESHSPPRRAKRAGKQSPTATNAYCLRIHSESSPVAVRFYGNILSQFESKTTPTEKEWVERARAAHAEQEYAKALACYEQALGVCLEVHGPDAVATGAAHEDVAAAHGMLPPEDHLDPMLTSYEQALAIRRRALGDGHSTVADSYNNIASTYLKMGQCRTALEYHHRALHGHMTACGPSHISVGDTYFHLGVAHQHLGESASALHWFKKALTIREEILGDNNAAVGRTYYNMAKAYEASNNRKDALACYERVLVAFVQDDTADLDDLLVVRKEVQALKALLAAEAEGRVLDRIRGKLAAKKNRRRRCTLM